MVSHSAVFLSPLTIPAAVIVVVLLQGRVHSPITDQAFEQGWREARVVQIGIGDNEFRDVTRDCRNEASPDEPRRYTLLAYRDGTRHLVRYVGVVPQDMEPGPEHVYGVNISNCMARWSRLR